MMGIDVVIIKFHKHANIAVKKMQTWQKLQMLVFAIRIAFLNYSISGAMHHVH